MQAIVLATAHSGLLLDSSPRLFSNKAETRSIEFNVTEMPL